MEENLQELIRLFYEDKQCLDAYKKSTDEYNKEIKQGLKELGVNEFETDSGLVAKYNIQKRESFNEDLLLQKLKELGVNTAIKTKEYVDMDELENLIYNGELNASELSSCRIIKEVETLKVTKKKGE